MNDDAGLDERIWALVRGAGVRVLWPAHPAGPVLRASAATTTVAGGHGVLSALTVVIVAGDAPAAEIELMTLVRERVLATRRSPVEEESSLVNKYLEREARRALALRSLEIREGEIERGGVPIGQLTIEREALLPPPTDVTLSVDGTERAARAVAYGAWSVAWADLPDTDVSVIVYARERRARPALLTRSPPMAIESQANS